VVVMVFNATFNNISVISWPSVLLVVETEYLEKIIDLLQVADKLYHIMLFLNFNTSKLLYDCKKIFILSEVAKDNISLQIFIIEQGAVVVVIIW
jgi:hypothetical protein